MSMEGHNKKLNMEKSIRYLDHDIKLKLIHLLDSNHGNNWLRLKAVMEDDKSLTNCTGCPIMIDERQEQTQQLLDKLQSAGRKTKDLIYYLNRMRHYQALALFGKHIENAPVNPAGGVTNPLTEPPPQQREVPALVQERYQVLAYEQRQQRAAPELAYDQQQGVAVVQEQAYEQHRAPPELAYDQRQQGDPRQAYDQRRTALDEDLRHSFTSNNFDRDRIGQEADGYNECPPIVETQSSQSVYIHYGGRLELFADVHGAETYEWRHSAGSGREEVSVSRGQVTDRRAQLKIEPVSYANNGWYWCVLTNQFGPARTKKVRVTVGGERLPGPDESIVIVIQPSSQMKSVGGACRLECQAIAGEGRTPTYQWIHFPRTTYATGRTVRGATSNVLLLEDLRLENFGDYICEIMAAEDGTRVFSKIASVLEMEVDKERYTAVDKVALLLGLNRYRNEGPLPALRNDVISISRTLTAMGFKVISMVNQNKSEMQRALAYFYGMLGQGIYGVVYLAGHGFEKHGRSYLKCYDCQVEVMDTKCALCFEEIKCELQARQAALLVLFVDICRSRETPQLRVDGSAYEDVTNSTQSYDCNACGNLLTLFATSAGMQAYEEGDSSIFSSCLLNCLQRQDPIQLVCQRILKECKERLAELKLKIHREEAELLQQLDVDQPDPGVRDWLAKIEKWKKMRQIPVYECNTHEYRSLMDDVVGEGNTYVRTRNQEKWHRASSSIDLHKLELQFVSEDMKIILHFDSPISNVLEISVRTFKPANWYGFAEISVTGLHTAEYMEDDEGLYRYVLVVEELNRLQSDLLVTIKVKPVQEMGRPHARSATITQAPINLGRPLLAGLYLDNGST